MRYWKMLKSGTEREAYPSKRAWAQPKLKEFLDAKGVYPQFVQECKDSTDTRVFDKATKWNNDISEAFSWAHSKEGYEFWRKLDNEFDKL